MIDSAPSSSSAALMDDANKLLGDVMKAIRLLSSYDSIFNTVVTKLADSEYDMVVDDTELLSQLIYFNCGVEIRKKWDIVALYKPQMLREPYISTRKFEKLSGKVRVIMSEEIAQILTDMVNTPLFQFFQQQVGTVFNTLLVHLNQTRSFSDAEVLELLGEAVFSTVCKGDFVLSAIKGMRTSKTQGSR